MTEQTLHPNSAMLQNFVEGLLGGGDAAVVESHLLECATCQTEVTEWRSLFAVLAELPQFDPSPQFSANVMARVILPDPWYVRALTTATDRVHALVPKTTRGWAFATAFLGLPALFFSALAVWLLTRPYITPAGLWSFAVDRTGRFMNSVAQGALTHVLQTDIALFAVRQLDLLSSFGVQTAGALVGGIAVATAGSAYILYQNLFRAHAAGDRNYASYSF